jgi:transcriptional regulator with XRE-family HTH domain
MRPTLGGEHIVGCACLLKSAPATLAPLSAIGYPVHSLMHLKTARRAAGLTQAELAQQAGVNQRTVSRLENGQIQEPSYRAVTRIYKSLLRESAPVHAAPRSSLERARGTVDARRRETHPENFAAFPQRSLDRLNRRQPPICESPGPAAPQNTRGGDAIAVSSAPAFASVLAQSLACDKTLGQSR